jgi:hypothetical protein
LAGTALREMNICDATCAHIPLVQPVLFLQAMLQRAWVKIAEQAYRTHKSAMAWRRHGSAKNDDGSNAAWHTKKELKQND